MQSKVVVLGVGFGLVLPAWLAVASAGPGARSPIDSIQFARAVKPASGTKQALVLMVSHASLRPSGIGPETMQRMVDEGGGIFNRASGGSFRLQNTVLPEPVLLPGDPEGYSVTRTKELSAAVQQEILKRDGPPVDPASFDILIYFYPTDTNREPFGASWKTTSGSRFTPAVLNIGTGLETRAETIAHEIGHAFFDFGHAGSAHPRTGEVIEHTADPYDLMGYGLDRLLENPADMGMTYRYYVGWAGKDEITVARALLVPTGHHLLWLTLITARQAYADETGGLLIRIDKTNRHNISHQTLDLTPETVFEADLHLAPGRSIVFDGRTINYVRTLEIEGSSTPAAEIRIEGSLPPPPGKPLPSRSTT